MRQIVGWMMWFALWAAVQACGNSRIADPRTDLSTAIDDFHQHLTWGRYSDAAGYLPQEQRGYFLGAQEEVSGDMRFTEYEVGQLDFNHEAQQAIVLVTLKWYRVPSYTIRETRVREIWTFDEESEYWFLTERTDPEDPLSPLAEDTH